MQRGANGLTVDGGSRLAPPPEDSREVVGGGESSEHGQRKSWKYSTKLLIPQSSLVP